MAISNEKAKPRIRRTRHVRKSLANKRKGLRRSEDSAQLIAWFKTAQASGGFFNHCKTAEPFFINDETTGFLFHLVNNCNDNALRLDVCPLKHLLAIYLFRLARSTEVKADEVERHGLRVQLLNFAVDGLALECAVQQFCEEYFGGFKILFGDVQQRLTDRNQAAKQLLTGYNFYAPKAGFEPITEDELQSLVSGRVLASTDELTRLSRATAVASFGDIRGARELLLPLLQTDMRVSRVEPKTGVPNTSSKLGI